MKLNHGLKVFELIELLNNVEDKSQQVRFEHYDSSGSNFDFHTVEFLELVHTDGSSSCVEFSLNEVD